MTSTEKNIVSIPAQNVRVGMLMVSPISGRLYEVINNKRIAGKWVEIESTSPVIYTKELNELVEVAMMPYEF